jgi:hypothetical protein
VGAKTAGQVLGVARATLYRRRKPAVEPASPEEKVKRMWPRALREEGRREILTLYTSGISPEAANPDVAGAQIPDRRMSLPTVRQAVRRTILRAIGARLPLLTERATVWTSPSTRRTW